MNGVVAPSVTAEQPLMDESGLPLEAGYPGGPTPPMDLPSAPQQPATAPAPSIQPRSGSPASPADRQAAPPAAAPATNDANDLFPADSGSSPPAAEEQDDLFPADDGTLDAQPETGTDDELFPPDGNEQQEEDLDKLFGRSPAESHWTVSFQDQPWRHWTDDTGHFHTHARLVMVKSTGVRLLKDNGRHCSVPFERLSSADRAYVAFIAKQLRQQTPISVASR